MTDTPIWRERCQRLWERVQKPSIDGVLIAAPTNVTYLTGFTGDSTFLLVGPGIAVAISDGRYEQQLTEECPGLEKVIRATTGEPIEDAVGRTLDRLKWANVAYEAHALTCEQFEKIRCAAANRVWEPLGRVVEQLRAVKTSSEIAAIRASIRVAEQAFRTALERLDLRTAPTETHFAGVLNWCMRELGASDEAFQTIVASGPRAALPHAGLSDSAVLRLEDGVLCDWGAKVQGYVSDLTRCLTPPRIAATLQKMLDVVLRARDAATAKLRPGMVAAAVDAEARRVITEAGFGSYFKHSTGHGIGLEVHELPMLRPASEMELETGMVVTIEPGIYLPGQFGVRIEEDVLVTDSGPEVLTSLPPIIKLD